MNRVVSTICLLLIVSVAGCGTYWYQSGKTLEQCCQDSRECIYDANKHAYTYIDASSLYRQCMNVRGYQQLFKEDLPMGIRTCSVDVLAGLYVAGQ